METKKCRRCKKIKSIKEFTTDKKAKGGRIGRCGACIWKQIKDRSLGIKKEPSHTTNIIRGLLCGDCNKALGLFRDNIRSLTIAIEYLQKYRQ